MKRYILFIVSILLAGCTTGFLFHVKIESFSSPDTGIPKKYVLLSGMKDVESSNPQFLECAGYVENALSSMGYIKVENFDDANIAVLVAYGIGNPQKRPYSYNLPIQSVASGKPITGGTYFSTSPTNYETSGYETHYETKIEYFSFIRLDAIDIKEYKLSQKLVHIWRTTVTSTCKNKDAQRVLPVLVAASKPYIGTNSGEQIEMKFFENDKVVLEIKGLTN